jgi:transposase
MEKEEQRFVIKDSPIKDWDAEEIHQELDTTLGDGAYGVSHIKIWLQRFRNDDLSCKGVPRPGRPPLTRGRQLRISLEKLPFASARVLSQPFLRGFHTIKNLPQRELGMTTFSRRRVPDVLTSAQKAA